jgi:hypothetical protein
MEKLQNVYYFFFFERLNFINNETERKTRTVRDNKGYTNSSQKKNSNNTNHKSPKTLINQLFT